MTPAGENNTGGAPLGQMALRRHGSPRRPTAPYIEVWGGGELDSTTTGVPVHRTVPLVNGAAHGGRGQATAGEPETPPHSTAVHRGGARPILSSKPASSTTFPAGGHSRTDIFEQLKALPAQTPQVSIEVKPLELDFDVAPRPPDYVVERLFERQTVNVLSGDTGAGKSLLMSSLVVAICADRGEWLGRAVNAERVLVIDEENPSRIVRERLRALGLENEHRDRLRYFNRQGFRIGSPEWTEYLRAQARDHRADVIIIDTAAAATNADVNDNDTVARLYSNALRPTATELNAAVVILHHERKKQAGQTSEAGQAMMGARQWAGQADTHVSIRITAPLTEEPGSNGERLLRSEFVMQTPKVRDGEPDVWRVVAVTSTKDDEGRLLSMSVVDGGRYERKASKQDALADSITALLRERGGLRRADIAKALDVVADGTLDRALSVAVERGSIHKTATKGTYGPAPHEPGI